MRQWAWLVLVATTGLCLTAGQGVALSIAVDASADSYVRGGGADNTNEGAATFLRVQRTGNNRALLRFDQNAIATAVAAGTLQSATLRLFIELNNGGWASGREIDAHRLLTAWSETGVTWNCPDDSNTGNSQIDCAHPWNGGLFNPSAAASYTQTSSLGGVVSIDVTNEVAAFLGGASNFGWLIKKREEGQNGVVEYTSRQGATAQRPQLLLDVLTPPTATPTYTPSATPTSTATFTPSATSTPDPACPPAPRLDCRQSTRAGKSLLLLADKGGPSDKLLFKWISGEETQIADFADPLATHTYALCLYDEIAGTPTLQYEALLPPGGTCGTQPCWKVSAKGYSFKDTSLSHRGIKLLKLRAGPEGQAKIVIKGKGANLGLPILPLAQDQAVVAQIKNDNGAGDCWEARFSGAPKRNDISRFKAVGDPPRAPASVTPTALSTTPTPTTTAAPSGPTPTPTATHANGGDCGNGYLQPGEFCGAVGDLDGVECATDCQVLPCAPTVPGAVFDIAYTPPIGTNPTSVVFLVGYKSDALSIPGTSIALSVRQRVIAADSYFLFTPNDLDYALRVITSDQQPIAAGRVFTVSFDACSGAPLPAASEVGCIVEGCAGSGGSIAGCTCEVTNP